LRGRRSGRRRGRRRTRGRRKRRGRRTTRKRARRGRVQRRIRRRIRTRVYLIFKCRTMSWFSWFWSSLSLIEVEAITASFLKEGEKRGERVRGEEIKRGEREG
jgi:hypothetical protein